MLLLDIVTAGYCDSVIDHSIVHLIYFVFCSYPQAAGNYRNMFTEFGIFSENDKERADCDAVEMLKRCDSTVHRTAITELEATVANAYGKYASNPKKLHKAVDGARGRCVKWPADFATAVISFWEACRQALVVRKAAKVMRRKVVELSFE